MAEQSPDYVLQQLRSGDPHEGWTEFLEAYSGLIFQVARHFERDLDRASDCFQFVCEKLSEDALSAVAAIQAAGSGQLFDLVAGSSAQPMSRLAPAGVRKTPSLPVYLAPVYF